MKTSLFAYIVRCLLNSYGVSSAVQVEGETLRRHHEIQREIFERGGTKGGETLFVAFVLVCELVGISPLAELRD